MPLPATAIFIVVSLAYAWLSDGPFRGRRWPFIYLGALLAISFAIPLRIIPLYDNIRAHFALYWLCIVGQGAGPLIMSWINQINSHDSEKRSILIAMANDFAYVVQAVGPLFYWKTTDFPAARKGWTAVIIYQILLGELETLGRTDLLQLSGPASFCSYLRATSARQRRRKRTRSLTSRSSTLTARPTRTATPRWEYQRTEGSAV